MEVLGAPSTFRFPFFFLGSSPENVALRRRPPAFTPFRSPPQRHGSRRLTSPAGAAALAEASPTPPESVEGEARAILRDFLIDHYMPIYDADRRAASWNEIVTLISSKLRSVHDSERELGVKLVHHQLVDLFTTYLRLVLKEYQDIRIIGRDGQLPSGETMAAGEAPSPWFKTKRKAIAQLERKLSEVCPPPHVLYLMNLNLDIRQIRSMVRRYPSLACGIFKEKLDCLMDSLISHGVPKSRAPLILYKCPILLDRDIKEGAMPLMASLENNGVDMAEWPNIIYRCPSLFTYDKAKIDAVVGYFSGIGLSTEDIAKTLTSSPEILCRSIDAKLKLVIEFLLGIGFTTKDIPVFLRLGGICCPNVERNLKPKWEFFQKMGYPRADLRKCPIYFTLSLEKRIRPRYELATKLGIRLSLYELLFSKEKFEKIIREKISDGCEEDDADGSD